MLPVKGPTAGGRFGKYEVEAILGRGGFGVVYRVRDPALSRTYALKILAGHASHDPRRLERFLREAQALARFRHPGLVSVHTIGREEGHPFILMDFVPGEDLSRRLGREGRLPPRAAAELAAKVARALEHAHQQGILHRDMKPGNILLDEAGDPHLTDFGLARDLHGEQQSLTETGGFVGTVTYASPEQARREKDRFGPWTDVYGLGAVLYEALGGEPPFQGESAALVLCQVLTEEPTPLRKLRPDLPRDLAAIVARAMAKAPEDRFASAADLADELEAFLAGGAVSKATQRALRGKTPWALAVGVLLPLALLLAVAVSLPAEPPRRAEAPTPRSAPPAPSPPAEPEPRRWRLLKTLSERGTGGSTTARFARAGRIWAVGDAARSTRVWSDAGLEGEVGLPPEWVQRHASALEPDGRHAWLGGVSSTLLRVDLSTLTVRQTLTIGLHRLGAVNALVLAPAGDVAWFGTPAGKVNKIDLSSGAVLATALHDGRLPVERLALHGDRLVTAVGYRENVFPYTMREWDPETLAPRGANVTVTGAITSLAFAPDGALYAAGTRAFQIRLVRRGGEVLADLRGEETTPYRAFDGDMFDAIPAHNATVRGLCFSPDGRRLYSVAGDGADQPEHSGDLRVWDLTTRKQLAVRLEGKRPSSVAINQDESAALVAYRGGRVELWELPEWD